jgi:NCAIR mutase (PurE)-related protein
MKAFRRQRGQVLVIVVGSIFLGGGLAAGALSSGATLKAIKKDIKSLEIDASREEQALDIVKNWKKAVKPVWKSQAKHSDQIVKLLQNQHTTAEAVAEQFALQTSEIAGTEAQVLELRDQLRSVLTRDEWERVFSGD